MVFCALFFFAQARAQDFPTAKPSGTEPLPPFIVSIEAEDSVPVFTDAEIWDRGVAVHFPQSRITVKPGDKGIEQLERACRRLADEGFYICRVVVVRGSASPEGTQQFNEWLSRRRGEVIAQKIIDWGLAASDTTRVEDILQTTQVIEDYYGLRRLMEQTTWAYAPRVIEAIDKGGGNMRKTKQLLRALDGGYIWMRLNKLFFPELRASRVVIVVSRPPEAVSEFSERSELSEESTPPEPPVLGDSIAEPEPEPQLPMPEPAIRRQGFRISTNLIYDLTLFIPQYGYAPTPNISVEWLPAGGHITAALEYTGCRWRSDRRNKTWIIESLLADMRYYFHKPAPEQTQAGFYLSLYGNTGAYDIQLSNTRAYLSKSWNKTWGCGLGLGYVGRIKGNWRWQANVALGYLTTKYDRYHAAEEWATPGLYYYDWHSAPEQFRRYANTFNYFGLTRIGLSLCYDLTWKKGGGL